MNDPEKIVLEIQRLIANVDSAAEEGRLITPLSVLDDIRTLVKYYEPRNINEEHNRANAISRGGILDNTNL